MKCLACGEHGHFSGSCLNTEQEDGLLESRTPQLERRRVKRLRHSRRRAYPVPHQHTRDLLGTPRPLVLLALEHRGCSGGRRHNRDGRRPRRRPGAPETAGGPGDGRRPRRRPGAPEKAGGPGDGRGPRRRPGAPETAGGPGDGRRPSLRKTSTERRG